MKPQSSSQVPEHKHCPVCGKPIPLDARFCSLRCEESMASRSRSQRRTTLILVGVLVLMAILWLVFSLKGAGT